MSVPISTAVFGVAKAAPPSSNSIVSPAIATDAPRLTRNVVAVTASMALSRESASLFEFCSAGTPGAAGAVVSFTNARAKLAAPALPATSVTLAVRDLLPSAPRSVPRTAKST